MKMKAIIYVIIMCHFILHNSYAQQLTDSISKEKSQLIALTPLSKNIQKVNGIAIGFGHVHNGRVSEQKINGINVEANPAPIVGALMGFFMIMHLPDIIKANSPVHPNEDSFYETNPWQGTMPLVVNGLNVSTGMFFTSTKLNGCNISVFNTYHTMQGISVTALGNMAKYQKGVLIGSFNHSEHLQGLTIGIHNLSKNNLGMQLGIVNSSFYNNGLQIGIINLNKNKGLQFGLMNINKKRAMPILNW